VWYGGWTMLKPPYMNHGAAATRPLPSWPGFVPLCRIHAVCSLTTFQSFWCALALAYSGSRFALVSTVRLPPQSPQMWLPASAGMLYGNRAYIEHESTIVVSECPPDTQSFLPLMQRKHGPWPMS